MTPDLVFLGNLLVDDIVLPDGRTLLCEPGGAMLYSALAARLWGLAVGLVTIAGSDYPLTALDALAARGVDLAGVRPLGRPGVRTWLLYEPGTRRVIHHLNGPTHFEVSPTTADVPSAWRAARAFHLAPMPIERQRELVEDLAGWSAADGRPPFVSLDPNAAVDRATLPAWRDALAHADAFLPSEDECDAAVELRDWERDLAPGRPRFLILKRGAAGGTLFDRMTGREWPWQARAYRVIDTTGAGDAFAGGFLAGWLSHGDMDRSLQQGVVCASYAIGDWGARGLISATPGAAELRREEWFGR